MSESRRCPWPAVAAAGLALALLSCPSHAASAAQRTIQYLYVEASDGGSSGGHAGIRFGRHVYHFQHQSPGLLRLQRVDWRSFWYGYAMLGNRTIRETPIEVSDETYGLLRDEFSRFFLAQTAQLELREELVRDVELFEELDRDHAFRLGRREMERGLRIDALGFFLPDGGDPLDVAGAATSPALERLRRRVQTRHGRSYIEARIAEVRDALRELRPTAADGAALVAAPGDQPLAPAGFAELYRDETTGLFALEVVRLGLALRPASVRAVDATGAPLAPAERRHLSAFADRLEADMVALIARRRPGWGRPLAIGLARLAAIDLSLRSGRLWLLRTDGHGHVDTTGCIEGRQLIIAAIEAGRVDDHARARGRFFAADPPFRETDLALLEAAANGLLDARDALAAGEPLCVTDEMFLPVRPVRRTDLVRPDVPRVEITQGLSAARQALDAYTDRLLSAYRYQLVDRNCVTELFTMIDGALARAAGTRRPVPASTVEHDRASLDARRLVALRDEAAGRLGGHVEMDGTLNFVPFISSAAVEREYASGASIDRPSYRELRLAELYADGSRPLVWLRESNTLTSTIHVRRTDQPWFLFFTDDVVLPRPLFGAVNAVVGLGQTMFGLLALSTGSTDHLLRGLQGTAFSLPELAFVNIRKGAMGFVPRDRIRGAASVSTVTDTARRSRPPWRRTATRRGATVR